MKMPWTTVQRLDPDATYVASVTHLRPQSVRSTAALFRGARLASRQLRTAPGVVGFATLVRPLARQYWTVSLWEDEPSIGAFARAGDHGRVMRELFGDLELAESVRWEWAGRDGRPSWQTAIDRMPPARAPEDGAGESAIAGGAT